MQLSATAVLQEERSCGPSLKCSVQTRPVQLASGGNWLAASDTSDARPHGCCHGIDLQHSRSQAGHYCTKGMVHQIHLPAAASLHCASHKAQTGTPPAAQCPARCACQDAAVQLQPSTCSSRQPCLGDMVGSVQRLVQMLLADERRCKRPSSIHNLKFKLATGQRLSPGCMKAPPFLLMPEDPPEGCGAAAAVPLQLSRGSGPCRGRRRGC